ncbi:MAG: ABC transporter ATP-binding protein, partial [Clostridiales bacterium]|nr:ABC transporter ATP-binding protein [Clostridiales bacterium]
MIINVDNVYKKFKISNEKNNSLRERFLIKKKSNYIEHEVLRGVSFTAEKGESIGLIGENGCGKSTLLKLMSKIMYPDKGHITIKGRVSSLIELGAGFHPHMSGRENIYTNAAIFGLPRREIDKRIEAIIDFAQIGEFIDNPVRTYSSGMYLRLAFSVAINVDADILLIDEILGVGDFNFQSKCYNRLRKLKSDGVTLVIVTHDLSTVENFCDKAIWLNNGLIESNGIGHTVVDNYKNFMNLKRHDEQTINVEHNGPRNNESESDDGASDNK